MQPLLETVNITKDFIGIRALSSVNFSLNAGEVHVLFGENGAGKSTLISLIAGAETPTSGEIRISGQPVTLNSVLDARKLGISAVFQEFSLIPQLSVEENLFLGAEVSQFGVLNKLHMQRRSKSILEELDFDLPLGTRVETLTRAEQQMVEIAKAFRTELLILILDEPTASLTQEETNQLFRLIRELKAQGVGIIYITHRMSEIREIGDRVTVLRDGHYIATENAKETSETELIRLMAGRIVDEIFPQIQLEPGRAILEVNHLSTTDQSVNDASVTVHGGEIVGLAGLVGSGKSNFAQACFGMRPIASGEVLLNGVDITGTPTKRIIDQGMLYLPSDRKSEGLMMMCSMRENIGLVRLNRRSESNNGWILNKRSESGDVRQISEQLKISVKNAEIPVEHFSGGNQQKIMLARALTCEFDLFVFDEPTVGVDVGTRISIYEFIVELARNGAAILIVSSDLPEILNLTTRVLVFYKNHIQGELEGDDITEENVLQYFFERAAA